LIPAKFEYLFILLLYALTGLSLCWDGLRIALSRRQFLPTLAAFFIYCLGIEILALSLGWWTFNERRVVGIYAWRIPAEELALFALFATLTIAAWESLTRDRN
jgi:lycopene cyclase domain-containing protein